MCHCFADYVLTHSAKCIPLGTAEMGPAADKLIPQSHENKFAKDVAKWFQQR